MNSYEDLTAEQIKVIISKVKKYLVWIGIGLFSLIVVCNTIVTVPTGSIGVKTQFGAISGNALDAGLSLKIPFIQGVKLMNCQTQKMEVDAASASKDLQTVKSKIAINFSIDKTTATNLYKDIGVEYQNIIISPAIQESIKAVSAQYTAEELITKRNEVSTKMLETITNKITSKGINVSELNILNFDFSDEYNKAIEAKQVAQQNTLKAQQDLERIKVEAEQKVAQANADATAKIANAKAEAESLKLQRQEITPDLLKLREIEVQSKIAEKWSGTLPTTVLGDAIPMLNITK